MDRLLASPHYGERWGRHWLDVARYADSSGHIHDDDSPNAWKYRDYVIQAFNRTSRTTASSSEQLAGDEMDEVTDETLIATGFHRVGPRVLFREKQNPQYRYEYLNDMVGTTSRAFLGLTVACARCHDHKFDPISQMDYYRMTAIFFPFIDYDYPLAPAGGSGGVRGEEERDRREDSGAHPRGEAHRRSVHRGGVPEKAGDVSRGRARRGPHAGGQAHRRAAAAGGADAVDPQHERAPDRL